MSILFRCSSDPMTIPAIPAEPMVVPTTYMSDPKENKNPTTASTEPPQSVAAVRRYLRCPAFASPAASGTSATSAARFGGLNIPNVPTSCPFDPRTNLHDPTVGFSRSAQVL